MLVQGNLKNLLAEAISNRYDIGVCAKIIVSGNNILLMKRSWVDSSAHAWEMPGGSVERGEDIILAVKREVKEETGLDISDKLNYIGCFDFHNIENGKTKRKFCFEVSASGEVLLSPDHSEYRFFTPEEIKLLSTEKTSPNYIFKDHYDILAGKK